MLRERAITVRRDPCLTASPRSLRQSLRPPRVSASLKMTDGGNKRFNGSSKAPTPTDDFGKSHGCGGINNLIKANVQLNSTKRYASVRESIPIKKETIKHNIRRKEKNPLQKPFFDKKVWRGLLREDLSLKGPPLNNPNTR